MGYIYVSHMTIRNWIADSKETKMKINANRLRTIRQRKKLSRPDLERASGINVRTIQRLENEPDECKTTREDTVMRLAKALEVEPGVLTGELPLPELDEAPGSEPDPVRIGAQIAPKVRLAYDLIKRRYGVNATDVITMAPLFFALLAEGSLVWRREKLKEALESFQRLEELDGYWSGSVAESWIVMEFGMGREDDSISKADLFGEQLCNIDPGDFGNSLFDPIYSNPYASYLRKLAADLAAPQVVDVDGGKLDHRSDFKFPYYDICGEDLDRIAAGSRCCWIALKLGFVRLSAIPDDLMPDEKAIERANWVEGELSEKFGGRKIEELEILLEKIGEIILGGEEMKRLLEKNDSNTDDSEKKEEGKDQ